jgi:molecular chaperone DnaK (HSP70)
MYCRDFKATQGGILVNLSKTHINSTAENFSNTSITHAVVAIPPSLSPEGQSEVKEASSLAGFRQVTFVPEPVAAVVAYKFDDDYRGEVKKVIVSLRIEAGSASPSELTLV